MPSAVLWKRTAWAVKPLAPRPIISHWCAISLENAIFVAAVSTAAKSFLARPSTIAWTTSRWPRISSL
jgi:hypothetical protein